MLNRKKEVKKMVLGLIPSVIGLALCINGLKSVEGELENGVNNGVSFAHQQTVVKEIEEEKVEEPKEVVVEEPVIVDTKIDN